MTRLSQSLDQTKVEVSTAPCKVRGFYFQNPNSYDVFVKFFNKTSANVTMGTTAPDFERQVPANGWICEDNFEYVHFHLTVAFTLAATKLTGSDNTSIASDIKAEVIYE